MEHTPYDSIREKMKPAADKLIAYFNNKGVKFSIDDRFENVLFTSSEKTVAISHHSFYRYSGIACISKELGDNRSEYMEVTDAMYLDIFMKPIIETLLKDKK